MLVSPAFLLPYVAPTVFLLVFDILIFPAPPQVRKEPYMKMEVDEGTRKAMGKFAAEIKQRKKISSAQQKQSAFVIASVRSLATKQPDDR